MSRADAKVVASAVALSESWPRRWFLAAFASMCGVSRAADRLFCALEDHREDRPVSPHALNHLKERLSESAFERIMHIHQIEREIDERAGMPSSYATVMTTKPLLIELGAGFRVSDAVRSGQRRVAKREARADLAQRQRQALDGK
ncbi:hypothetical protein K6L09_38295 [Burkholderia cepacia]